MGLLAGACSTQHGMVIHAGRMWLQDSEADALCHAAGMGGAR